MEILHQLGELFLQAVPTVLIILVFYMLLRVLFFQPVLKVMAERETRTAGARKAAENAQAVASEKVKQYHDEQEAARKTFLDERAAKLKDARAKAAMQVGQGKETVAKELTAALRDVEIAVPQLSAEIANRLLQSPLRPPGEAR
jgi:F-type H+-transporting ATPase subunit b